MVQVIVNQMPPHRNYFEPFLGSGAVLRAKRPAEQSSGVDLDPDTVRAWHDGTWTAPAGTNIVRSCGIRLLEEYRFDRDDMVYVDPPYLHSTRTSSHRYRFDLCEDDHCRLLRAVNALGCMVIVSGYPSRLYGSALGCWRQESFWAMTHGGMREEILWMNYPTPHELHDHRFLGANFRDRERIRRTRAAILRRVRAMGPLERAALMAELGTPEKR